MSITISSLHEYPYSDILELRYGDNYEVKIIIDFVKEKTWENLIQIKQIKV